MAAGATFSPPKFATVQPMDPVKRASALVTAYAKYQENVSKHYDEVVDAVIVRVQQSGSFSKLDIGALASWKRLRADTPWMRRLMSTPDTRVQAVTSGAVELARDESRHVAACAQDARSVLTELDGFSTGDALASTLCYAAAPHRLAVYDRRARRGLVLVGLEVSDAPGRYGRYIEHIEDCREELTYTGHSWTARQVDLALFQLGG